MVLDSQKLKRVTQYQNKWRSLYLKYNSPDRKEVENAIDCLYRTRGLSKPKIEYYNSPIIASKNFDLDYWGNELIRIDEPIETALKPSVNNKLWQELHHQIYEPLHRQLWREIGIVIYDLLRDSYHLWHDLNKPLERNEPYFNPVMDFTTTAYLIARGCLFDYIYTELNCQKLEEIWQSYYYLAINCGWLLTYRDICFICDRTMLKID